MGQEFVDSPIKFISVLRFEAIVNGGGIAFANVSVILTIEVLAFLEFLKNRWVTACIADYVVIEPLGIACDSCLKLRVLARTTLVSSFFCEIDESTKAEHSSPGYIFRRRC